MTNGYDLFFDTSDGVVVFPITPSEITIKVGSNNTVISLINEGDINVLKAPSLTEVAFEARFPMRQYPYSRKPLEFKVYHDIFKKLKEQKMSFRLIIARKTPNNKRTWDTNLLMALEEYEIKESVDEGDDVLISFTLKQYKEYGVKRIKINTNFNKPTTTSTSKTKRNTNKAKSNNQQTYTVKKGDCLWNIAKRFYGKGSEWKKIYNANKSVIESTAKKYGKKSSSNGHWIYPGTKLTLPSLATIKKTSTTTTKTKVTSGGQAKKGTGAGRVQSSNVSGGGVGGGSR